MKRLVVLLLLATLNGCASMNNSPSSNGAGISLNWEMYPDPRKETINPGEEIIFKLNSISTNHPANVLTMVFGDGTSENAQLSCENRSNGAAYQCSPVYFSHVYKEDNFYHPYVKTEQGSYPSASTSRETSFIIAPIVKTDEEFKELAFSNSAQQLQEGIKEVLGNRNPGQVRFALTSFKNANFEYAVSEEDKRDINIMKKLTTVLVNNGYSVLEKNPQALIRLAHESIVKKDNAGRPTDEYQDSLEYGLRTEYSNPSQPFVYGAQIEGVKASDKEYLRQQKKASDGFFGKVAANMTNNGEGKTASKEQISESDQMAHESYNREQARALYFAKFSTADYVITIDRKSNQKEDIILQKSNPIYFDIKFNTKMIERTARTEYAARILERNGNIVWVKNIVGEAQEKVIPEFVKASAYKQQGINFGDLFINLTGN